VAKLVNGVIMNKIYFLIGISCLLSLTSCSSFTSMKVDNIKLKPFKESEYLKIAYDAEVSHDYNKALKYYKMGCDNNDLPSCTNLGNMYFNGRGVIQNHPIAYKYYEKTCFNGEGLSCSNLGYYYENGINVERDVDLAVSLYQVGCKALDPLGCLKLGHAYYRRNSFIMAKDAYEKGCNLNNSTSCYQLSYMYKVGLASPINNDLSKDYIQKACNLNSKILQWYCN